MKSNANHAIGVHFHKFDVATVVTDGRPNEVQNCGDPTAHGRLLGRRLVRFRGYLIDDGRYSLPCLKVQMYYSLLVVFLKGGANPFGVPIGARLGNLVLFITTFASRIAARTKPCRSVPTNLPTREAALLA